MARDPGSRGAVTFTGNSSPVSKGPSKGQTIQQLLDKLTGGASGSDLAAGPQAALIGAAQRRTQAAAPVDPLKQFTDMLSSMGGISMPSSADIAKQASAMASGTYDPQIAVMRGEQKAAKGRAGAAKKDIAGLFDGLVNYYQGKVEPTKAMFKGAKQASSDRTSSLKGEITADYTNRLKEQVDQYKALGIEAAVPSATGGQYADEASQLATADNTGAADLAALGQQETGDLQYWNAGGATAKQEGVEDQTAITTQLNDYLNRSGGQIAGMQAAKKAAYSQAMMQLQQQAAQSAQQQQNTLWNHMLDLAKLRNSMAGSGAKQATKGLLGANEFLSDPRLSGAFQTALTEGSTWKNTPQAKLNYGGHTPTSPEEWAQMIRDNAANKGMSPADQTKLWQAALIYFGKLQ